MHRRCELGDGQILVEQGVAPHDENFMSKWRPQGGSSREKPGGTWGRGSHGKLAIVVFEGGFLTVAREGEGVSFSECFEEDDTVAFKGTGRDLPTSDLEMGR